MKTGVIEVRAIGPIVHLRTERSPSMAAREAARAELAKALARAEPYGVVIDLRGASLSGLTGERGLVEVFVSHRDRMAAHCRGVAVVVGGRATKAVLAALARLAPTRVAIEAFPHAMAAEAWLRERLSAVPA